MYEISQEKHDLVQFKCAQQTLKILFNPIVRDSLYFRRYGQNFDLKKGSSKRFHMSVAPMSR